MLTCTGSKKLISRAAESGFKFVDAELFEHLKGCVRCAEELKSLKKMRSAFEAAPRYIAPRGLTEHVMRRIHFEPPEKPHPDGISFRNLAAGFALFFALAAGIFSGTFLASNIMDDGVKAANTGNRNTLLAYSADAIDPAPPDLVAGDYLTVVEDANER